MKSFLSEVTHHLIDAQGLNNLASTTIVVPTRRAVLFVKDCFKNYMRINGLQGPVQLPEMTTLAQLFDDLSPRYKIDEIQLVCTLYRVYCDVLHEATNHESNLSLDIFYGWGRQLVQDFSNIDKTYPLVTPQDFLKNTASARKLEHLEIDDEVRERLLALVSTRENNAFVANSKRREFEVIWKNLPLIYERFQTALADYGYEGARMKAALEHWEDDSIQRRRRNKHVVFAGFNYLVPAEKRLMHLLQDAGQASFYWDYPADFTANRKAFRWIIANAKEFGNALAVKPWQPKDVEVICTTSAFAQAQFVSEWLQKTHQNGQHSAVVICDESALEQVVYALPADAPDEPSPRFKHINITKGFPIRQTDVFARMMALLQTPQDLTQTFDCQAKLAQIEQFLIDETKSFGALPEDTEELQLAWHELLARESVFQLQLAFNRFRLMIADGRIPAITNQRTLRLLLRRYLEGISFPFHGEPLADVQVTGVLETRAMDFDNVLLLNVEEGVVPNVSADLSYLPYYLRKAYGLQTHEESTDVYAYNFFRLTYRAQHVTMLFTGAESKYSKKAMSRFLRQMMASDDFRITRKVLLENNTLAESVVPVSRMQTVQKTVDFLSPSALNTFRECKMKFYLQYVAQIKKLEEETPMLNHADIGTLVHDAMQELYAKYPSPIDVPEPIPFDDLQTLKIEGYHPVELAAVHSFVSRIVQSDKLLAKSHKLKILSTESKVYMNVNNISVGGRIDRVDEVDGITRIVDYKTGAYKDDYAWQIRIYKEAYKTHKAKQDEPIQAVLYICKNTKPEEDIQMTVDEDPKFQAELENLLKEVVKVSKYTLSALPQEEFDALFASKSDTCKKCAYKLLCNKKVKDY